MSYKQVKGDIIEEVNRLYKRFADDLSTGYPVVIEDIAKRHAVLVTMDFEDLGYLKDIIKDLKLNPLKIKVVAWDCKMEDATFEIDLLNQSIDLDSQKIYKQAVENVKARYKLEKFDKIRKKSNK